jgi:hypothetical protein
MLKEDISKEVQKRLGLSDEDFTTFVNAVSSEEETELALPNMHTFTPEEFESFKQNTKKTKKPAWIEESVKEFKTQNELEFQGKDFNSILEYGKSLGAKEAGKEPNERFNELKNKYDLALSDIDGFKSQLEQKDKQMFVNGVRSELTSKVDFKTAITPKEIYTLYSQEYEPVQADDILGIAKKGMNKPLEDERYNKIKAHNHFLQFAEKYKIKASVEPGGGGGSFRLKQKFG